MKTITILGSSGQIGLHLTSFLKNRNYHVQEFDIERDANEDLTIIPNLLLEEKIKNSDFVYFLAFDVGGSRYLEKNQYTYKFINNNSRMMVQTFSLLEKYKKPFVFASSQMSNMKYSPYGILKSVGEIYTKSLEGLIVKFWNVYGIENNKEKSHVITDFIQKALESEDGIVNMLTDGTEERQFLFAEDCCEALEIIMTRYKEFSPNDELHITSFEDTKIIEVSNIISEVFHHDRPKIKFIPSLKKDSVQKNKKNIPNQFILSWWKPRTSLKEGISIIFEHMKRKYEKNET